MKFYNRENELSKIQGITKKSEHSAQFTVLTGRRRIGKTRLLLEALPNALYFFVSRKSESLLCADFIEEIKNKLHIPILGEVKTVASIFDYLMQISKNQPINVIIDEFQEFYTINSSVYSDFQKIWDLNKENSKINLFVCGSVHSIMHRIFENQKEPLFGRANNFMQIKPFATSVLKVILNDYSENFKHEDLLAFFTITGGVPKYIQWLMDNEAFTAGDMIDSIISEDSLWLNEGKNILIEEFGKEYTTYFSILTAIAKGENTRPKIEQFVQKEVSGFITRLENDYSLIKKSVPLFSKTESRNIRYVIEDNFLLFWFRFIYKYNSMIEIKAFDALREIIKRDFDTYCRLLLERYFKLKNIENQTFTSMGGFWDRKGLTEIDFIGVNEISHNLTFAEIKLQENRIRPTALEQKAEVFLNLHPHLKHFNIRYCGWSMKDM